MFQSRASIALGFVTGIALASGAGSSPAGSTAASGGTLRVVSPLSFSTPLDPAQPQGLGGSSGLWQGMCATLMAFRDAPAPSGDRVQPEAAVGPPTVSRDRRTYVFTVRNGLRFSDGSALRAENFVAALHRVLDPAEDSYGAFLYSDVERIRAQGRRVRIELRKPAGDLPMRMALPYACPVPLNFPVDPAGATLMGGSGPYGISLYVPGQQLVITRNPQYHGPRPRGRIGEVVVTFGGTVAGDIQAVESGQADLLGSEIPPELRPGLVAQLGINRRQLFRWSGSPSYPLILNTSRPLFRDNVDLRKAVNFALDRTEIAARRSDAGISTRPTDQIIPSAMPGWTDQNLYPLRPDLRRASRLARGHLRDGKAILYVFNVPDLVDEAQVIVADLQKIGLDVTVKPFALAALNASAGTPGEPFDMLLSRTEIDYPDPANVIIRFLGGANASRSSGNTNFAYFKNAAYDRRMAAANRLVGEARTRAFARLDADLMRNEAPWAPLLDASHWLLFSTRVGCIKPHPVYLAYWSWCLRGA